MEAEKRGASSIRMRPRRKVWMAGMGMREVPNMVVVLVQVSVYGVEGAEEVV